MLFVSRKAEIPDDPRACFTRSEALGKVVVFPSTRTPARGIRFPAAGFPGLLSLTYPVSPRRNAFRCCGSGAASAARRCQIESAGGQLLLRVGCPIGTSRRGNP